MEKEDVKYAVPPQFECPSPNIPRRVFTLALYRAHPSFPTEFQKGSSGMYSQFAKVCPHTNRTLSETNHKRYLFPSLLLVYPNSIA